MSERLGTPLSQMPHLARNYNDSPYRRVFETAQALISRFDKLGLLSGRRWNKRVVYHAVNQLL